MGGAEVSLLLILLHHQPVGPRGDLPIDVSQVVPGEFGPILRELYGKGLPG